MYFTYEEVEEMFKEARYKVIDTDGDDVFDVESIKTNTFPLTEEEIKALFKCVEE